MCVRARANPMRIWGQKHPAHAQFSCSDHVQNSVGGDAYIWGEGSYLEDLAPTPPSPQP